MPTALGELQIVENFVPLVYIVAGFNMDNLDNFCSIMMLLAYDGKISISNSNSHLLECFCDEERMKSGLLDIKSKRDGVFWEHIRMHKDEDEKHQRINGKNISLRQLVSYSYCLCNLIYEEYKEVSGKLVNSIQCRLSSEERDKVDNANNELTRLLTKYNGEMYLRWLFFTLKEQLMIKEEKFLITLVADNNDCMDVFVSFIVLFGI